VGVLKFAHHLLFKLTKPAGEGGEPGSSPSSYKKQAPKLALALDVIVLSATILAA
jgi:hypothetical protein